MPPQFATILWVSGKILFGYCLHIANTFTARCTLVQSAVLRSHVVCLFCQSVRLSVTLVNCDQIGCNSSKIISPLVSVGCSLFATPTWRSAPRGIPPKFGPNPPQYWFELRRQIAAEWLQIAQRSQWRAYRKLPSLFLMVSSLTSYDLPPQNGGSICPQDTRISATGDPIHFMFCSRVGFSGTADLMALFSVRTNSRWRPPPSGRPKPSWIISNGHISATAHDLLM